jgi:hypothetical protein
MLELGVRGLIDNFTQNSFRDDAIAPPAALPCARFFRFPQCSG